MKHRITMFLLASLIFGAMCFASAGCSRRPAGEGAASNTSATNANSAAEPATAAATSSEQAPASSSEAPASKSDSPATAPAGKADPLTTPAAHEEKPPPPPRTYTLAAGRPISIYTTSTLSTKTSRAGDSFVGTLSAAIVDKDWVIAKKSATVEGVVTRSDPGGKVKGVASLTVVVKRLQLADGRTIELSTSSFTSQARTTKKKDAIKIGGGAAAGAVIGAIIGGKKGAAIGAGVGGGAGTGAVLATRGDPATIPAETPLTFRLRAPVTFVKR